MKQRTGPMLSLVANAVLALLVCCAPPCVAQDVPAFPGAEGFGADTPGGRGGKVLLVTNLNDSGPGSFREACEAEGPRIVVFRVSGNIELESPINLGNPYITIAGQTAPGDGICLNNCQFFISTHDVVIRHMRFRPGDLMGKDYDALWIWSSRNVIIDHCSASWGIDETLSITGDSDNITVQWCMVTESLHDAHYGSLVISDHGRITWHHNVYAHHNSRCPRTGIDPPSDVGPLIDFRNNLIYDWGAVAGYTMANERSAMNYVANYLRPGPSTSDDASGFAFRIYDGGYLPSGEYMRNMWPAMVHFWVADNYLEGFPEKTEDNWLMIWRPDYAGENDCKAWQPFKVPPVETDKPQVAYERILEDCGATLPVRDAVDARIVEQIRAGTGKIIDSQADIGGWPELKTAPPPPDSDEDGMPDEWEEKYGFDPNDSSDNSLDTDEDVYTNIEEYLNGTDPLVSDLPSVSNDE